MGLVGILLQDPSGEILDASVIVFAGRSGVTAPRLTANGGQGRSFRKKVVRTALQRDESYET
jgi:hypothetical protein